MYNIGTLYLTFWFNFCNMGIFNFILPQLFAENITFFFNNYLLISEYLLFNTLIYYFLWSTNRFLSTNPHANEIYQCHVVQNLLIIFFIGYFITNLIKQNYGILYGLHFFLIISMPQFLSGLTDIVIYRIYHYFHFNHYSKKDFPNFSIEIVKQTINCNICFLDKPQYVKLPCQHNFCEHCILKWFNYSYYNKHDVSCPFCRRIFEAKPEDEPADEQLWQGINLTEMFSDYSNEDVTSIFVKIVSGCFLCLMISAYIDYLNLNVLIFHRLFILQLISQLLLMVNTQNRNYILFVYFIPFIGLIFE